MNDGVNVAAYSKLQEGEMYRAHLSEVRGGLGKRYAYAIAQNGPLPIDTRAQMNRWRAGAVDISSDLRAFGGAFGVECAIPDAILNPGINHGINDHTVVPSDERRRGGKKGIRFICRGRRRRGFQARLWIRRRYRSKLYYFHGAEGRFTGFDGRLDGPPSIFPLCCMGYWPTGSLASYLR